MGSWTPHKPAWMLWTPGTLYLLPLAGFLLAGIVGLLWHDGMGKLLTVFAFGMYTMNVLWIRFMAAQHDATLQPPTAVEEPSYRGRPT